MVPEEVTWLWPGRVPFGKLTLVVGDPGLGKSFLMLDMAARLSQGRAWPDDRTKPGTPQNVAILSDEDGLADTIRPRLDKAEADMNRIRFIRGAKRTQDGDALLFSLVADMRTLNEHLEKWQPKLLIIDPVSAYLGGADGHSNTEVRSLLSPLSRIAESHGCAIILISHMNKAVSMGSAIYRAMGSLAFVAASRMAWLVCKDKDDEKGRKRLLLGIKTNLTEPPGGLRFEIVDGCVHWHEGRVDLPSDEAIASCRPSTAREDAKTWLQDLLSDGAMEAEEIFSQAKLAGISKRTLQRIKGEAGVKSRPRDIDGERRWAWWLEDKDD